MIQRLCLCAGLLLAAFNGNAQGAPPSFKVLALLSPVEDHRQMMKAARPMLEEMARENHFQISITDDASVLNAANLRQYAVVVQLQEAPFDIPVAAQQALQQYIESGKGWVGIHAAGLTGKSFLAPGTPYWQWFEGFMGGVIYWPHPAFQKGTVIVEDHTHPITKGLPAKFEISDEWYEFDKSPRGQVRVLATADETTYHPNKPMGDHPIIWVNEKFRRMVYIGIGHDASLCSDPNFTLLLKNAINWAAEQQ
ncbi:chitinase/hypothetical protein [Chitinophaga costaii]|uniref:ThuA-like domain-containing protein n=1 Tax=Chitinophaga costaii TaxID=1335309 RepID=A0A1C4CKA1_9BACT|nr:ThuA domain-containing protein [Chitinophaga costaii]PUZ27056.1 ThuA domain-containing protein [Chitinophaga costaii]SCC19468.1 chitinase/hypothetical protein [Chitinophaga costaii]